jgi:hypothetical protein
LDGPKPRAAVASVSLWKLVAGSFVRRFPIWCLGAAAAVSVSVILSPGPQISSPRFASAAAWLIGLILLWVGARVADPGSRPVIERRPVAPPLSTETERVVLVAVLLVAVAYRFVLLAEAPPFVHRDESLFLLATDWRPGHSDLYGLSLVREPKYFPHLFGIGWNSIATLCFAIHWLPVAILGPSIWSVRLGCAATGVASVYLTYRWSRRWWGPFVALAAAFALSVNAQHVYWSRIALNNIDTVLVGAASLAAFAWAVDTGRRVAWVALGYALAAGLYTHHMAKAHIAILGASTLLAMRERRDWRGAFLAVLAFVLVTAPLVPEVIAHWDAWYGYQASRADFGPFSMLYQGKTDLARHLFMDKRVDIGLLFHGTSVAVWLFFCGVPFVVWHWKDVRYATVLLWLIGTFCLGFFTGGPIDTHILGVTLAMSVVLALGLGHAAGWMTRYAFTQAAFCVLLVAIVASMLYQSWWAEFVWRQAKDRNQVYGLCRAVERTPLPAVIYVAGDSWKSDSPPLDIAMLACGLGDPRRRVITLPPEATALPRFESDPNVTVIVFHDRFDVLTQIRLAHPEAIDEPYLINGIPVFYVVRLRSSCPVIPLLQVYDACG